MAPRKPDSIAMFDVDGTFTAPRKVATPLMLEFMKELRKSLKLFLGEEKLKWFINLTLRYIANLDIPIKGWQHPRLRISCSVDFYVSMAF
ncbi:phosphomannomutase-like [Punica granatum]|uniref:Phosphomannomutase n=1 Tax=Punica granatum TaxID=22663 RepID=A0A6P8BPZ2_PUNGR|nr:phosphomannomutase-like [Punica granatum]XP_031372400.1 phosphomannomutase-like [Punica granatum]